ncbi:hypothetical protein K4F52_008159 [Lecanicillium sp. MT-2017a]|nr:hypothetical protein K4F52_008159 [Lecanicillium sp. MT-2017a]
MGRKQPSVARTPVSLRRNARAKQAKETINVIIPRLLSTHPRARRGINATELLTEPLQDDGSPMSILKDGPRLSLQVADTLTAARSLLFLESNDSVDLENRISKVAILNMASPLSPGGGFLNGANSQEESLCRRTTLLPSLKDDFYRLPELGVVYSPDVLVFRDESCEQILEKKDRWYVDCITAAMLRNPDCEHDTAGNRVYETQKDRDLALAKMRAVLRVCRMKGIQKLVLGAWGCGAYGNPPGEIASGWRKALGPPKDKRKCVTNNVNKWDGIKEVVFAIKETKMARQFAIAFGDDLLETTPELGIGGSGSESSELDQTYGQDVSSWH